MQKYLPSAEADFIKVYGEYYDRVKRNKYSGYIYEEYQEVFDRIKDILPIIHWGKLPLFNRYLLYNRGVDPEKNTVEFYDHIDCLNALLAEIRNKGICLSNESDNSLDRKMIFRVYNRRWGHEDRYIITRTIDGWHCGHISINGECKKDGTGSLISNLEHDCIFYPKDGVKYAMQRLWEDSDDGIIDFDELSRRIQQVADWISAVEKAVGTQPDWVGYY